MKEEVKPAKEPEVVVKAVEAPKEVEKAPPTPPPAAAPKPKTSSGAALGKVSGTSSGGQILQKEEVSADVINMLKVCVM